MRKIETLTNNGSDLDTILGETIEYFNSAKEKNPTIEYKDLQIVKTFGQFWVVLVYEHEELPPELPELPPTEEMPVLETPSIKSQWIGVPDGIDPRDPKWREKMEVHRQNQPVE